MTFPDAFARQDRLHGVSVLSAPVWYKRGRFFLNPKLPFVEENINWTRIFRLDMWFAMLLWFVVGWFIEGNHLLRNLISARYTRCILALFEMLVRFFFTE